MASSSVLSTAAGWLFAAACMVVSIVYFNEIRVVTSALLGLPPPGAEQQVARTSEPEPAPAASTGSSGTVELRADSLGHFMTAASVNGSSIDVMVDTGASIVAFTYEDAERAGIFVRPADFTHRVSTANGQAKVAPVMVSSISIGDITVRNVRAAVSEPGKLNKTLLGMTFLGRLSRAEMRRGRLILEE